MKKIIKTDRLYLREFVMDDAFHLYKMNSDPEVLHYTGDEPFRSEEAAAHFIQDYDFYTKHNMGRWAMIHNEDDTFLGWCGLKYHKEERIVEVGYRLYQKYWGKGYATEAAKAAIKYGFEKLRLKVIYAHVHVANKASHRVAQKAGLSFVKDFVYDGKPAKLYHITNPHYSLKEIDAQEAYKVRHPVLRKGKPIEACKFDEDRDISTLHMGMYFKNDLVGVVTFTENSHPLFKETLQFQLRGMAVLEAYRNKRIGEHLVSHGETVLNKRGVTRIWLNARKNATAFYKRLDYVICSKEFEVPIFGPHFQMTKKI
ncbi:GNAT family N-acetyltransferase [Sungkyunkwania multivorans]|uniref:GNAT family N-acetyltransferase n=1 Tax=Sungkyunkwania multivorans TaxID=1173618 RepID=A0ABW3D0L3_9FLAO